jgi:hypothetical protein
MQKKQLLSYMHHPGKLDRDSLEMLRCIKDQFPYFTTARLLLIRNLYQLEIEEYQPEIEITAAYVVDRRILYEIIHPLSGSETEVPEAESAKSIKTVKTEEEIKGTSDMKVPDTAIPEEPGMQSSELLTVETVPEVVESPVALTEKAKPDEKPDLRQNISNLLSWQLHEMEQDDGSEEELLPEIALDIQKTYGNNKETAVADHVAHSDDLLILDLETDPPDQDQVTVVPAVEEIVVNESGELHCFTDWLSALEKPVDKETATFKKAEDEPNEKILIDKFIESNPRLEPPRDNVPHTDISADSVKEHDGIFTDTLARIYIKQGYYSKAIFAYEKLILKYPEKSDYFAGQIKEIKKLTNKQ